MIWRLMPGVIVACISVPGKQTFFYAGDAVWWRLDELSTLYEILNNLWLMRISRRDDKG